MAVPVLASIGKEWLSPMNNFGSWVYALGGFLIPLLMLFLSLSLIYKLAPRRHTQFTQVWAAALCATVLLQTTESLFIVFLKNFAGLHAVYGAFCVIVALLTWIYLFGCIFIFGACLCAAQAEARSLQAETNYGALTKRSQTMNTRTLNSELLHQMDAYWRAANYLSVGQIYLLNNPLLKRLLTLADVKHMLLGHWGTTPGRTSSTST